MFLLVYVKMYILEVLSASIKKSSCDSCLTCNLCQPPEKSICIMYGIDLRSSIYKLFEKTSILRISLDPEFSSIGF